MKVLAKSVNWGVFGLLSILGIYIVSAKPLWHSLRDSAGHKKVACLMALGLVVGFFIYGLTVETFNLKMTAAFYALTVAVFLATATNRSSMPPNNLSM